MLIKEVFGWQTDKRHSCAFLALTLLVLLMTVVIGSGCEEGGIASREQNTDTKLQDKKPRSLSGIKSFSLLNPPGVPGTVWQIISISAPFKERDKLKELWDVIDEEFIAQDGRSQFNNNDIRIGVGQYARLLRAIAELKKQDIIYDTKVMSVRILRGRFALMSFPQSKKERTIMFSDPSGLLDATDFPDGIMKVRIDAKQVSAEQFSLGLYPVVFYGKSKERKSFESISTSIVLTPDESLVMGTIEGNPRLLGGFFVNDKESEALGRREITIMFTPQVLLPPEE